MFNKNFYPTPTNVAEYMVKDLDLKGKIILEPQAGKGNIIEVLKEKGAKTVIACELNEDLAYIVRSKADEFLKNDFFKVVSEEVSHIDFIVMNPPYDMAVYHIIHAWEIAPPGCKIVSLCNTETVNNQYTEKRKQLGNYIDLHGETEEIGDVFIDAERSTAVKTSMVTLRKPGTKDTEFSDYLFSDEEEVEIHGDGGLVKYSYMRDIVGRYIQGVKMYDNFIAETGKINAVIKPLGGGFRLEFNAIEFRDNGSSEMNRETFKKNLQKSAWKAIFRELKMQKYLTKSALEEVNKFVELQTSKPFTMRNIMAMVEIIVGTHGQRMDQIIISMFDWLTEHHSENRMNVEGWKTNSMYMVNRKFIAPYCGMRMGYSGQPEVHWSASGERMDELVKALCQISGTNYDDCIALSDFFRGAKVPDGYQQGVLIQLSELTGLNLEECEAIHPRFKYAKYPIPEEYKNRMIWDCNLSLQMGDKIVKFYNEKQYSEKYFGTTYQYKEWGKWYDWNFFEIRVYKKGTFHAKFKDEKVWQKFNLAAAKAKGWQLPQKTTSDFRQKSNGVEVYGN